LTHTSVDYDLGGHAKLNNEVSSEILRPRPAFPSSAPPNFSPADIDRV
jgi:hypothetical protein